MFKLSQGICILGYSRLSEENNLLMFKDFFALLLMFKDSLFSFKDLKIAFRNQESVLFTHFNPKFVVI